MKETGVKTRVTYTLNHQGKFYIIENVPARMCRETGEEYFSPETVERIHGLIHGGATPVRMVGTHLYSYT
ncbi:conserved hypothetical protein [Candidatus Desulfarcum epimagneticum]|uniref:YgiT-type zinc finger domain-containing protein n=1 Tax=uncultured Desulfobacteraceae bacterium TaxID=218296 RepID=A0A484HE91_9BACT|nr:conserved hypothetical protein [uncultured Desulfobacteraceae bacterium]